jgi:hypothetical protein
MKQRSCLFFLFMQISQPTRSSTGPSTPKSTGTPKTRRLSEKKRWPGLLHSALFQDLQLEGLLRNCTREEQVLKKFKRTLSVLYRPLSRQSQIGWKHNKVSGNPHNICVRQDSSVSMLAFRAKDNQSGPSSMTPQEASEQAGRKKEHAFPPVSRNYHIVRAW